MPDKPLSDALGQPINGVPDTDPPAGLSPGGKKLWEALRIFGTSGGDPAALRGLLTRRVTYRDGYWIEQELDEKGNILSEIEICGPSPH